MQYKAYTLRNFRQIPQISALDHNTKLEIDTVGNVLPFKVNNYVVDELIDWSNVPDDPIFRLTFPQKGMLGVEQFDRVSALLYNEADKKNLQATVDHIRGELNPHPGGQQTYNVPILDGKKLNGVQHKYKKTVLFFPSQGQTCHAFCTFCFRWPQFLGNNEMKFAMRKTSLLIKYLWQHPEISDLVITGGDPLIMKTRVLSSHLDAILDAKIPHLKAIRIGSKALSYWPNRFLSDSDADEMLYLFERVQKSGVHLSLMAHFNHPRELESDLLVRAVARILQTGIHIRTQSPILNHINAHSDIWRDMWQRQVDLGMIPYYMFIPRDTGAQHYFSLPLVKAWQICRSAHSQLGGLSHTARGPVASTESGKIQMLGVGELQNRQVMTLQFLQGRDPDWVYRPFFAAYDSKASWIDELRPASGEKKFFFQKQPDYPTEEADDNTH